MKKLLTLFALAMMMLGVQNANASVKLTALDGNNWSHGSESPKALLDEQTNSKWGTWDGKSGNPVYVIMKASAAIAPKSYELIIANDTPNHTGRNWKNWKIYGGNFDSDAEATQDASGWVLIDEKADQTLTTTAYDVNKLDISGTIPNGTYYSYFKIVVEALAGNWNDDYCQMDGFRFTNVKFKPQDVTFTYSAGSGNGNRENEGMDKLFDLDCSTKYCGNTGSDCYALVTASEPVFVWGYDLTTANDNNNGRKVSKWSLYGTNDADVAADPSADGWVTLSNIASNNYIEGKNWYTQRFFCNKSTIGNAYKYFKVTLDEGGFVQLSEFRFCYDTYRPIAYNFKSGPSGSESAFDGLPNTKWGGNASIFTGSENAITIETSDGNSYAVKKYHFSTDDDGSWKNRAPKSWTIEGSNDNSSWTTIAEVDDAYAIHNTNRTTYEFTPSNTTDAFRYVRLTLNSMKGTGYCQIGDFQVLAVSDVSDKDYYTNWVNNAKAAASGYETLMGATDPWYVEYKSHIDALDATLASCKSSGNYDPIAAELLNVGYFIELMTPFAEGLSYSAIDGTPCFSDSPYSQLFDGKDGLDGRPETKWGGNFTGSEGDDEHVQYVIFRVKTTFAPYFYKLVTGGDTHSYTGRNWKSWSVYGGNFANVAAAKDANSSSWVLLDQRTNITEAYLPMENNYPAAFNFTEGVNDDYYYYMVKVIAAHNGSQIQMSEMYLCTQSEFETVLRDPLIANLADFDKTRPIEASKNDKMTQYNTLYDQLLTEDDPVELTLVYNQLVALRTELEESMDYMEFYTAKTVEGVFQLGTADELKTFAAAVNNGRPALNAVLTANINLNGVAWTPIGNGTNKYTGTFDGQNHAITNFSYTSNGHGGLFGWIYGAIVKDFSIGGTLTVTGGSGSGVIGTAGIEGSGYTVGTISGIHSTLTVNVTQSGVHHVGGIVGWAYGSIDINRCSFAGSMTVANGNNDCFAGVVGYTYWNTIQNCANYGNISFQQADCKAGGVLGYMNNTGTAVKNCLNTGTVAYDGEGTATYGGAIIGHLNNTHDAAKLTNNYWLEGSGNGVSAGNVLSTETNPSVTTTQLASGEVAYKLNGSTCYEPNWFQNLSGSTDANPVLYNTHGIVNKISAARYTTQYIPTTDVTIPEGVEVFAGVKNGSNLTLAAINDAISKADAVILRGNEGYYSFLPTTGVIEATTNDLKGSDGTATGGDGIYALSQKGNPAKVGFYPVGSGVTIPAGKAYLNTNETNVKGFFGFEEDDATGISLMEDGRSKMEDGAIYNVAGQRISKMQRGINIVNGKKILK